MDLLHAADVAKSNKSDDNPTGETKSVLRCPRWDIPRLGDPDREDFSLEHEPSMLTDPPMFTHVARHLASESFQMSKASFVGSVYFDIFTVGATFKR